MNKGLMLGASLVLTACNATPAGPGPTGHTGGTATAAGSAAAPTKTVTYRVSTMSGTELGRIEIPPGKFGTLTLTAKGDDADGLKKLWDDSKEAGVVTAKMHVEGKNGERGGLTGVSYKPSAADYAVGVRNMLMSRYYNVADAKP